MKKITLAILLFAAFLGMTGCTTPPETVAYRTEGTVITTVDTAMKAWADWVNAGHASQSQVDTVKSAYQKYYSAQQLLLVALDTYAASKTPANSDSILAATQAAAAASGQVIALIQPLIQGK